MFRFLLIFFLTSTYSFSNDQQVTKAYEDNIQKADVLFREKDFQKAVGFYELAFESNNSLGKVRDRYKAASCWALLQKTDSAFFHLERIAFKGNFTDDEFITTDINLIELHRDPRWVRIVERIRQNKLKQNSN